VDALAESIHEVDDLCALACGFFCWKRFVIYFRLDEFFEGDLVFVFEFVGDELCGFPFNELFGERELVFVDRDFLDVVEVRSRVAEFFGVAHDVGHHAGKLVVRGWRDGDEMFAAAEGDFSKGNFFCCLKGFADYGEGFGLSVAFGGDEVGLFDEGWRDLVFVDELVDSKSVTRWDAKVLDLFGLDGDVLAFAIFVAFDDLAFLDGALVGCEFLMMDALAGSAAELVKTNLTFSFGGGKELDAEGDEGDLNLS